MLVTRIVGEHVRLLSEEEGLCGRGILRERIYVAGELSIRRYLKSHNCSYLASHCQTAT